MLYPCQLTCQFGILLVFCCFVCNCTTWFFNMFGEYLRFFMTVRGFYCVIGRRRTFVRMRLKPVFRFTDPCLCLSVIFLQDLCCTNVWGRPKDLREPSSRNLILKHCTRKTRAKMFSWADTAFGRMVFAKYGLIMKFEKQKGN